MGGAEELHQVHPWQSLAPRDDPEEPRGRKKKKKRQTGEGGRPWVGEAQLRRLIAMSGETQFNLQVLTQLSSNPIYLLAR